MSIVALGLNHATAPIELRERASVREDGMGPALRALHGCPGVREAAILSTCNRTDLYCGLGDGREIPTLWFDEFLGIGRRELAGHLYVHREDAAVRHVMRVASGLDSMILGEPQILGQLKQAHGLARREGSLGVVLDKLFQRSFAVAKRVRTDTGIGASPVSVAFAAVTLARRIFEDLDARTALLVGAGETIELCARHLASHRIGRMVIANRTVEHARRIATALGAYAISLDEAPLHLAEADIVVSSTGSREPVISAEQTRAAVRRRRRRPMFMVDLAVPHDIERAAGDLPDVYLYAVDDLAGVIEEGRRQRITAAGEAEGIIDRQVAEFMAWMRGRRVSSTIARVRESAAGAGEEVLAKARRRLRGGEPAEAVIEYVARTLTNKLMHAPSVGIRAAGTGDRPDIVEAARMLFGVADGDGDPDPAPGFGPGAAAAPEDLRDAGGPETAFEPDSGPDSEPAFEPAFEPDSELDSEPDSGPDSGPGPEPGAAAAPDGPRAADGSGTIPEPDAEPGSRPRPRPDAAAPDASRAAGGSATASGPIPEPGSRPDSGPGPGSAPGRPR